MRLIHDGDRMVLRDTPGCFWLLGLMFVGSGTLAALAGVGLVDGDSEIGFWARAAILFIGAGHLFGAFLLLRASHATEMVLDRVNRVVTVRTRGVRRVTEERHRFSDVAAIDVLARKDGDGDLTYTLRLWLRDSTVIPLHSTPAQSREALDEHARVLRDFIGIPRP